MLTIYPLAQFDNIPELHGLILLCSKMRKNSGTKGDILVEITLSKTIMAKFEFRRVDIGQIGVKDAERVELCKMMSTYLVCTDKKLYLSYVLQCCLSHRTELQTLRWSSS